MHARGLVTSLVLGAWIGLMSAVPAGYAADAAAPPEDSPTIQAAKERGALRVGILAGYPWLQENTTGQGEQWEGPAWILANEYADRLGVELELVPVSHETKVPVVQSGQVDMTIAPLSATEQRKQVVDFVVYSNSSVCMFGRADNPKLQEVKSVDDLNRADITVAYFTGAAEEPWVPQRFPEATARGVTGSGTAAPVEEIMSGRADVAPIDRISWVALEKQVPGLTSWPSGEDCLTSDEFSVEVGLAVSKDDPAFVEWARAVAAELQPQLQEDELRLIKEGDTSGG